MSEILGIIKDVSFGCRDTDHAALWFTIKTLNGCALQRLSINETVVLLEEKGITDIRNLEGKPCVADFGNGMIKFRRLLLWWRCHIF